MVRKDKMCANIGCKNHLLSKKNFLLTKKLSRRNLRFTPISDTKIALSTALERAFVEKLQIWTPITCGQPMGITLGHKVEKKKIIKIMQETFLLYKL